MKPNATATTVAKPTNKVNLPTLTAKDSKETKGKKEETTNEFFPPIQQPQEKKQYTIEELKNKSIALDALTEKHNTIIEKTQELDKFKVLHEESQAKIVITDVNGLSFESTNPKTISQVIELWKVNFNDVKCDIESRIRQVYSE